VRSADASALAWEKCGRCAGAGLEGGAICECVCRAVFRICLERFHQSRELVSPDYACVLTRAGWARPAEEYIADVLSIAERTLSPVYYEAFRLYFQHSASTEHCCRKLEVDPSTFRSVLNRVRVKLGRAFIETRPYPLYPLHHYFRSNVREYNPTLAKAA
jgi:predicted DNA-binding protein (UPF0251 family)